MKCFKVNLDYEAFLFDPHYKVDSSKSLAMIREFEYVFFLINKEKCILKNYKEYSEKYLQWLHDLGFTIPHFDPKNTNFENWWGLALDKKLEQRINSKITSADIALKNNWGMFDGTIIQSPSEAESWIKKFYHKEWILKNPFGVSGSGNQNYLGQDFIGMHLLEPKHSRIFDIGTTFEFLDGKFKRMFMVENKNSNNGSFKGGIAAKNQNIFKRYILNEYQFDLSPLEEITQNILKEYEILGANSNLQIDSFVYLENGQLKLYPLVEVNYRKTMGLTMQRLADHLNNNLVEWRVTHTDQYEKNIEWKKISPDKNRFNSYFRIIEK